jgi:hypothetical protein
MVDYCSSPNFKGTQSGGVQMSEGTVSVSWLLTAVNQLVTKGWSACKEQQQDGSASSCIISSSLSEVKLFQEKSTTPFLFWPPTTHKQPWYVPYLSNCLKQRRYSVIFCSLNEIALQIFTPLNSVFQGINYPVLVVEEVHHTAKGQYLLT